ncbi:MULTISPECIES: DinB family protein [unclassified Marinobacter]|uniref:DinB family protein n=1 Tax=unclassified Marinobacter TaxID=83889 RepID=UPI00126932F3|nr:MULTISPECIES: DinB family protein [unclassified Marinobacter]QFS89038.1 DinB family protein [Marinobacter sp. THAF197a]QFT52823.1 DinB family protein [Marinobacter sp. THAF39]
MSLKEHFELLASYNQWMNSKVYAAAGQLPAIDLVKDRGAFFGSILGTLNHILVGDTIWLKRFATHPSCLNSLREVADLQSPESLDQVLFEDIGILSEQRIWLDRQIVNWIAGLSEGDLDFVLSYRNTKGVAANKRYSSLVLHFFNHQTHHRGQVSTLLSQAGMDVGVTDLLAQIPEEAHA